MVDQRWIGVLEAVAAPDTDVTTYTPAQVTEGVKRYYTEQSVFHFERQKRLILAGVADEVDPRITALKVCEYLSKGPAAINFINGVASANDIDILNIEALCMSKVSGQTFTASDIANQILPEYELYRIKAAYLTGLKRGAVIAINDAPTPEEAELRFIAIRDFAQLLLDTLESGGDVMAVLTQ